MTLAERFWVKADRSGGSAACWPWTGSRNVKGYGRVSEHGRPVLAHRVAWALAHGEMAAPGMGLVLHHCDSPPCVNPGHLYLGTAADNTADMMAKGRHGSYIPEPPRGGDWYAAHPRILRGEAIGNAKLTEGAVRDIRARRVAGETLGAIALRYGISAPSVHRVIARTGWRHVV